MNDMSNEFVLPKTNELHIRAILWILHPEKTKEIGLIHSMSLKDTIPFTKIFWPGRNIWYSKTSSTLHDEVPAIIRHFHPQIADLDLSDLTKETSDAWLAEQINKFGEWFHFTPFTAEKYIEFEKSLQ